MHHRPLLRHGTETEKALTSESQTQSWCAPSFHQWRECSSLEVAEAWQPTMQRQRQVRQGGSGLSSFRPEKVEILGGGAERKRIKRSWCVGEEEEVAVKESDSNRTARQASVARLPRTKWLFPSLSSFTRSAKAESEAV